jgi:hypothetical protein
MVPKMKRRKKFQHQNQTTFPPQKKIRKNFFSNVINKNLDLAKSNKPVRITNRKLDSSPITQLNACLHYLVSTGLQAITKSLNVMYACLHYLVSTGFESITQSLDVMYACLHYLVSTGLQAITQSLDVLDRFPDFLHHNANLGEGFFSIMYKLGLMDCPVAKEGGPEWQCRGTVTIFRTSGSAL